MALMKSWLWPVLLLGICIGVQVTAQSPMIDTRPYFPLNKKLEYRLQSRQTQWQISYEGPTVMADHTVYVVNTKIRYPKAASAWTVKYYYSIDTAGDIYLCAYPFTEWLTKWLERPELVLRHQMEVGKEYIVADATRNNYRTVVTITLKKVKNLKLQNTALPCIMIERTTKREHLTGGPKFMNVTYSYEQKYYAQGIGLIKHTGVCSCCGGNGCAAMAPSGGAISLEKD
jgi:hypothetical protein